jgi:hypothetical protein
MSGSDPTSPTPWGVARHHRRLWKFVNFFEVMADKKYKKDLEGSELACTP